MKTTPHQPPKRQHERVPAAMPVHVGEIAGTTRNVSVHGMYIELNGSGHLDGDIEFEVEIDSPAGRMLLRCVGQVVRCEHRAGRAGIAVKVTDSHLVPLPAAGAAPAFLDGSNILFKRDKEPS